MYFEKQLFSFPCHDLLVRVGPGDVKRREGAFHGEGKRMRDLIFVGQAAYDLRSDTVVGRCYGL